MAITDKKFSSFQDGGNLVINDIVVGLRNGINTRFLFDGFPGVYLPLAGGTMTGDINMNNNQIINLPAPINPDEPATKAYADTKLALAGGTMTGQINMGGLKIVSMADPTLAQDAATKAYVDSMGSGSVTAGLINQLTWYAASGTTVSGLPTAASGVLVTSAGSVPSIATDIPTAVTIGGAYIYRVGGNDVSLADGGTNASLTASNGGIFYSTATAAAILAGTATATQMLQSGASGAPAWSTSTWPATTTANAVLFSSATNTVGQITSAANSVMVTSAGSVPSFSTTLPTDVQDNITRLGTVVSGTWQGSPVATGFGGTGLNATPANGQLLIGNGTTFSLDTLTPGTNITIDNTVPGQITINATGGGGVTSTDVQNEVFNSFVDSGVADAYVGSISPAVVSLTDGLRVRMFTNNSNQTQTPTLDLNSLGATLITLPNGTPLSANDINLPEATLEYSTFLSSWVLQNPANALQSAFYAVNGNFIRIDDTSVVPDVYEGISIFYPTYGVDNCKFVALLPNFDNTGACTFDLNSLGQPYPIQTSLGVDVVAGDIVTDQTAYLLFQNVTSAYWQIINPMVSGSGGSFLPLAGGTMTGNIIFASAALAGPDDIRSSSGERALSFNYIPSAVNYFVLQNADSGNRLRLIADGIDANVGMVLSPKNSVVEILDSTNTIGARLRFSNANGLFNTTIGVDAAQSTSLDLTLPAVDGNANNPMVTDGSGKLSFLSPVAFSAYNSTLTTCAANTVTNIDLQTETYDIGANFASSRFTCTRAGIYHFDFAVAISSSNLVAGTQYEAVILKNGAQYVIGQTGSVFGTTQLNSHGNCDMSLSPTDYVELGFFNGNAATTLDTNASSVATYLSGHWVCALS